MKEFWEWLGNTSNTIGVGTFLLALATTVQNYRLRRHMAAEQKRMNEVIELMIYVTNGSESITLPITIRRCEVSRAEVLGRIGMIPMRQRGQRFTLAYCASMGFCEAISGIVAGHATSLLIPATQEELNQFDL